MLIFEFQPSMQSDLSVPTHKAFLLNKHMLPFSALALIRGKNGMKKMKIGIAM